MSRRSRLVTTGVIAPFLAVHLLPMLWEQPRAFPDTVEYAAGGHAGPLSHYVWAGPRPPLTGLLHWLCANNDRAVVIVQAIIAGLCWGYLAVAVIRRLEHPALRVVAVLALLATSATGAFQLWDADLLSDSLSVSLLALLVAVSLNYVGSRRQLVLLAAAAALTALVRDSNAMMLAVAAAVLVVVAIARRGLARLLLPVAGVVAVVGAGAVLLGLPAQRNRVMMLDEVQQRVLPNAATRDFYAAHGMPVSDVLTGYGGTQQVADRYLEYRTDPRLADFRHWLYAHGMGTKLAWSLDNPRQSLVDPFTDGSAAPLATFSNYAAPGHRDLTPSPFRRLVRPHTGLVLLVELIFVIALGTAARWRGRLTRIGLLLLILAPVHAVLVWNAEALEIARHGLAIDLQLRLALILTTVGTISVLAEREHSRSHQRNAM